jgi:hypothetical protein
MMIVSLAIAARTLADARADVPERDRRAVGHGG